MSQEKFADLKMYILVKDTLPVGLAMNSVAHGVLMADLQFGHDSEYLQWKTYSFKKVTCKVTDAEFEKAKGVEGRVVVTESALGNQEVVLVFRPRLVWPGVIKFAKIYK